MDRFIPTIDEYDQPEYQRLRKDPEWLTIVSFIRKNFWHVTSKNAWRKIVEANSLKPNLNGRYTKSFGSITERSFGYVNGLVSLFDFVSPSDEELMRQWGNAWDVMVRDRTGSILLEFDRDQLVGKIVSNSAARIKNTQFIPGGGYIPFVEVWYPDEIPANAILAVYEIEPTNRFEFVPKRIE